MTNKKLVFVSICMDRLRLLDRLTFKDEFQGDVYLLSDDRLEDKSQPIKDFVENEATNVNIKKAKVVRYIADGIFDFICSKVSPGPNEHILRNMLFSLTCVSSIYFASNPDDAALILDDDVIMFKNPEPLMNDGLKAVSLYNLPREGRREIIIQYFKLLGDDVFDTIGIQESDPQFLTTLDDKYGKLVPCPTTCWDYQPDFPEFIRKYLYLEHTQKHAARNIARGAKLYQAGFTFLTERLLGCYFVYKKFKRYDDIDFITQDRSKQLFKPKDLIGGKVYGYHYMIIADSYVQKYLPILVEQGYDAYKEAVRGKDDESRTRKYAYYNEKEMQGWVLPKKTMEMVKGATMETTSFDLFGG